jgi:hypothetical protein
MRIYKDSFLNQEVSILDFGIVPAGSTEKFTFYIYNDTNAHLKDLEFSLTQYAGGTIIEAEVEIVSAPSELESKETKEIIFKWSPIVTLKEGLKAQLKVTGIELWG